MSAPAFLKWPMILFWANLGISLAAAAGSFAASKSLPGTRPIVAIFATIGASASAGGLSFISFARSVKYSAALILWTWSRTGVLMSIAGSTLPAGGVYGLP